MSNMEPPPSDAMATATATATVGEIDSTATTSSTIANSNDTTVSGSNQEATSGIGGDERASPSPSPSPPPLAEQEQEQVETKNAETDTSAVLKEEQSEDDKEDEEDGLPSVPQCSLPSYELETLEVKLTATASSTLDATTNEDEEEEDVATTISSDKSHVTSSTNVSKSEEPPLKEDDEDNDPHLDAQQLQLKLQLQLPHDQDLIQDEEDDDKDRTPSSTCCDRWNVCIGRQIHHRVTRGLQAFTYVAASYPRTTLIVLSLISVGMAVVGLLTNFRIETDNHDLWPPTQSLTKQQSYWLYQESHFNYLPVEINILVHRQGANVASQEGVAKVFEAIETVTQLEGYGQGCAFADLFGDSYGVGQCHIYSVADFWNESSTVFHETVNSDQDVLETLSSPVYPSTGVLVEVDSIMGNARYQTLLDGATQLESAESFSIQFAIPWSNVTLDFEATALKTLLHLRDTWRLDPSHGYQLEVSSFSSFSDEFLRAIFADLYLIPIAFVIVTGFTITCCFGKWDKVHSRGLLGMGAVLTIVASVMTTFGLLFAIGVPFTTQTLMVPFLMFGIGLDDAYIIYGSYHRKDSKMNVIDRIQSTMEDVGVSIFLTSLTSVLAFILGAFSRIPAVQWLCLYAFPCIAIDFFYQITFFIALVVLDEKRIQENRRDYCTWIKVPRDNDVDDDDDDTHELRLVIQDDTSSSKEKQKQKQDQSGMSMSDNQLSTSKDDKNIANNITASSSISNSNELQEVAPPEEQPPLQSQQLSPHQRGDPESDDQIHPADRLMGWFATHLIKPWAQAFVMLLLAGLTAASVYWATQLRQEFDFTDLVPRGSYVKAYYNSQMMYTRRAGKKFQVYFRDVDFADPAIQEQMQVYLDDLIMSGIVITPVYFWLWDFQDYVEQHNDDVMPVKNKHELFPTNKMKSNVTLFRDLTFDEQVHEFLSVPIYYELYDESIGVTKEGQVMETRLSVQSTSDPRDSHAMTDMLKNLRSISAAQPINEDDWRFFCYQNEFHMYEFYRQVIVELIFNTVTGLVAVTLIALFFIPHWSSVFFVFPFITLLYINMLGYLYISGVMINAVSYVTLVMSIGLMVDYVMHVLMRYYDSKGTRRERVLETLSSMGASILMGAVSTFLGLLVLAFSTSSVLQDIFISCVGLVCLGTVNGLVFLPVVLSLIGPEH